MKFSIPILLSLLTSVAFGRPTVKDEEGSCIATNFFRGGKSKLLLPFRPNAIFKEIHSRKLPGSPLS
jgi:hypothetical protein